MKKYLLSIYQPDLGVPEREVLDEIMQQIGALNEEMKTAGALMITAGLQPASAGAVVRTRKDDVVVTDGPYVESKEHVGGFWMIRAPDIETALEWGRKIAKVTTLPIEVRAIEHCEEG